MVDYLFDDATRLADSTVIDIQRRLSTNGWLILQSTPEADLEASLLSLRAIFGGVVRHPFSREEGVVVVDNAYRPPRGMSPHTDGTYYPEPPAVVCLQCVTPAKSGGASTLVDGARLYAHLARSHGPDLPLLFEPVLGVRRNDRFVRSSVFWRAQNRVCVRFRSDETIELEVTPAVRAAIDEIRRFVEDPANQIEFKLERGQILVTDNTRFLHGRTPYDGSEPRHMNRMHLDGLSKAGPLQLGFVPGASA